MFSSIRPILVVVDPTLEVSGAVAKAAGLAQGARPRSNSISATSRRHCTRPGPAPPNSWRPQPTPWARRTVATSSTSPRRCAPRSLTEATAVESANPFHEAILHYVIAHRPDLVVEETHPLTQLSRPRLTHTDRHSIDGCPASLLLVTAAAWRDPPVVVVAVDPNHPDDAARPPDDAIVATAVRLAHAPGTPAGLIHVFSSLHYLPMQSDLSGAPVGLDIEAVEALRQLHRSELAAIAGRHGLAPAETTLAEGLIAFALPEYAASHRVDILALGAVARSRLHDRFIGSTATRVLDRIASDLLMVKIRPPPA